MMRESWRRKPPIGNTMTSWKEAYRCRPLENKTGFVTECLYEAVPSGLGDTPEEAKEDFLENIRMRITELSEMLQFCSTNNPKQVSGATNGVRRTTSND